MHLSLARPLIVLVVVTLLGSCSRAPELVGIDNPERPAASVREATRQKVFIATTRAASEVTGVFFSGQRAPELGFASVVVSIPPNHEPGQLERPKALPPDPRTEFAVIEPAVYDTSSLFVRDLRRELARRPPHQRDILLFIHGYNNTTSDAILRIAQFVEDTEFEGVPVLFTWASAAKVTRYVYDLNSVLVARPQLLETGHILSHVGAHSYDIFAHSMGAFLLMETAVLARQLPKDHLRLNLASTMLAAPDIDMDLFRSQLGQLGPNRANFYVFVSKDDRALRFSQRISGGVERVGRADAEELAELGVKVIDLSEVEDSSSGTHSKFAGSPEIVQLIGQGLQDKRFNVSSGTPSLVEVLDGVPVLRVLAQ